MAGGPETPGEAIGASGPLELDVLPRLTLRRNFYWTLAGNIVYTGCQWGMLVAIAKLGTPEMVGQFALGFAIAAPVFTFANLQLDTVQATDAREEYVFADYLGLRILTSVLAVIAIVAITRIGGYQLETMLAVSAIGLAKGFEAISFISYGLLQRHERMDRNAKSLMIKGPLSLIILALAVYLTGSIVWGCAGLVFAWALVLIGFDRQSAKRILLARTRYYPDASAKSNPAFSWRPRLVPGVVLRLFWLALPLGFVSMLIALDINIPRYFIQHYFGDAELGIFAATAYLMVTGGVIVTALGQATSPRLAKYYAAGDGPAFRNLLLKLLLAGLLLGSFGILMAATAGGQILTLFYTSEYSRVDVFFWVMVAAAINYIGGFLGWGIMAGRMFSRLVIPHIAATVSSIAFSALLVPRFGLVGAAWSLCAFGLVNIIIEVFLLKKMGIKKASS